MMDILDPHLHLFNLTSGDYHWLSPDNPPFWSDKAVIAKNFSESHLLLSTPFNLKGFVHIEAGFDNIRPWREIEWLEATCQLPFRAIAGVDLTVDSKQFAQQIAKLKAYISVVGVRHILDEQALELLCCDTVVTNISQLNQHQLGFEVQMPMANSQAVEKLIEVIAQNRNMSFIINHSGLPPLNNDDTNGYQQWQQNMKKLASFQHVAIKCSGWEMLTRQYTDAQVWQVISICLELFGDTRVMLASNFPLTLFSCSYQSYWQRLNNILNQENNKNTIEKICSDNAKTWYKISLLS